MSVLSRLLKMGRRECRDPVVLAMQRRIYNKMQKFMVGFKHFWPSEATPSLTPTRITVVLTDSLLFVMQDTCQIEHRNGVKFRLMVILYQLLLKTTPPELHYLASNKEHFHRLNKVARLPGPPADGDWPNEAQRLCFERCQRMADAAAFDRLTNVRRRIAIEMERYADGSPPAGVESPDETIEQIFGTYVPMWQAWFCTLLQFVRLKDAAVTADDAANMPPPPATVEAAAAAIKSEPPERPAAVAAAAAASQSTADGDDDVIVVVAAPQPQVIELMDMNATQQLSAQLITPALEADATSSDATRYMMQCLQDETSASTTTTEQQQQSMTRCAMMRFDSETLKFKLSMTVVDMRQPEVPEQAEQQKTNTEQGIYSIHK